jgi:hypothetical protein
MRLTSDHAGSDNVGPDVRSRDSIAKNDHVGEGAAGPVVKGTQA